MRCLIVTAWSSAARYGRIVPTARRCRQGPIPNDLWCIDFKGEFKFGNGWYCYPLTVTDHTARYLLLCE